MNYRLIDMPMECAPRILFKPTVNLNKMREQISHMKLRLQKIIPFPSPKWPNGFFFGAKTLK